MLTGLKEIRVNWAYQSNNSAKEDTSNHFHIFVGDLSNEVNDEVLLQAFSTFGPVSEARVMWDMKTGRSRGYGFVAFRDRADAERALSSMDGEWLGSRAIRCNWANQKGQPSISQQQAMASMGMTPTTPFGHHHFPTHGVQSYDMVVQQTPQWQTTCYVGNLTPYTAQSDLVPLFQNFGYVTETRFQSDRGFAFIKMDTHENAAMAICQLNGYNVNGRPLKCSVSYLFPLSLFYAYIISSGAKTVHLPASLRAILLQPALPTPLILRRLASTSRSTAAPVAQCHLKVSGTGGSFGIEATKLIRRQAQALVLSLSRRTRLASAGPAWPNLTSRCLAVLVAMVVVVNPSSSSGASPPRATFRRMDSVATRVRSPVRDIFPCALIYTDSHDMSALCTLALDTTITSLLMYVPPLLSMPYALSERIPHHAALYTICSKILFRPVAWGTFGMSVCNNVRSVLPFRLFQVPIFFLLGRFSL